VLSWIAPTSVGDI
jgi:hypothetical protein